MASYEVVAMVQDTPARLEVFARYYNRMGAERVTLFYNGKPDEAVFEIDGIDLVVCDDEFWKSRGLAQTASVEDRQRAVYNYHYPRCHAEWMLVVDCDEFVFGETGIGEFLDEAPASSMAVRVNSAEAVFTNSDDIGREFSASHFRLPFGKWSAPVLSWILYGSHGSVFIRGLLGHAIGKEFVRTGLTGVLVDIHHISRQGTNTTPWEAKGASGHGKMYLAHFDTAGFNQWRFKWDRRALDNVKEMGRKRELQQDKYVRARERGRSSTEALFRRLYCLNGWQLFLLRAINRLVVIDLELNRRQRSRQDLNDSVAIRTGDRNAPLDWPQRADT